MGVEHLILIEIFFEQVPFLFFQWRPDVVRLWVGSMVFLVEEGCWYL